MKVHIDPVGLHSHAMVRIAAALRTHAPDTVQFVRRPQDADIRVFYVIGRDALSMAVECSKRGQGYIPVQCCLETTGVPPDEWMLFWHHAVFTWSYYDLSPWIDPRKFMHAPLGVDHALFVAGPQTKSIDVVTTGYVSGPNGEAIEEVWDVVDALDLRGIHIGPKYVSGMPVAPRLWNAQEQVTDEVLANYYRQTKWVAALRHVEGFELPAAEGLACGARPILFDQPTLRHWYGRHAVYVPDVHGNALVDLLRDILSTPPEPLSAADIKDVQDRFSWTAIACDFWSRV